MQALVLSAAASIFSLGAAAFLLIRLIQSQERRRAERKQHKTEIAILRTMLENRDRFSDPGVVAGVLDAFTVKRDLQPAPSGDLDGVGSNLPKP